MTDKFTGVLEQVDCSIYYEVYGAASGIPLFVLHGGPGFAHDYLVHTSVWNDLGKNRPVIFYDQRGTGKSELKNENTTCTLEDQINDLDALRQHLCYEKIELLGHSWGGFLGMAYTARCSARVASLILVDSAAPCMKETIFLFDYIFPETIRRRKKLAFSVELGDKDAIADDTKEKFSMLCYSPEKSKAFVDAAGDTAYNYDINKSLWADLERFDLSSEIQDFSIPTLIITGRYDINVAPLVAYRIHNLIPASQFVVFEKSGHLPFFEEPENFFSLVNEFLTNH